MFRRWGIAILIAGAALGFEPAGAHAQTDCQLTCNVVFGCNAGNTRDCSGGSGGPCVLFSPATVCAFGSAGDDVFITPASVTGPVCYCGEDGADTVMSGTPNADWVFGGNGADNITTGAGDDLVFGEGGDDIINSGAGNDFVTGNDGADQINGGPGIDSLDGNAGDDMIDGGDDADTINGGTGSDTLTGGAGGDIINGGDDNDTVFGGDGADTINGGAGGDTLNGEGDADTISGGTGNDMISGGPGDDPQLNGDAGDDTISGGAGADDVSGGDGTDMISGGDGDDTLNGDGDPDVITGGAGDDTINGGDGNDNLDGGVGGADTLNGQGGDNDICTNFTTRSGCELASHAAIASVEAFESDGTVVLRWVTSSESSTLGFYVSREVDGEWVAVHEGLLPGLMDSAQGGVYELRDPTAAAGESQRYLVTEVDVAGVHQVSEPFDVTPSASGTTMLAAGETYARSAHALDERLPKGTGDAPQRAGMADAMVISVSEDGLYRVPATQIATVLGVTSEVVEDALRNGGVTLTESGSSVSWMATGDAGELRFVGSAVDSIYTRNRLYRLTLASGTRIGTRDATPSGGSAATAYVDRVHLEEDLIPATLVATDPESDYWYWLVASAAPAMSMVASTDVVLSSVSATGTHRVSVDLHGAMDVPHEASVFVNGALAGTTTFSGIEPHSDSFNIASNLLVNGNNTIRIEASGNPASVFFVNSVDLDFERTFETNAEASAAFDAPGAGAVLLGNIAAPDAHVLDVTDARQPVMLEGWTSTPAGAGVVDIGLQTAAAARYLVVDESAVKVPNDVWGDVPSDLRGASGATYIAIAPAVFYDAAQQLVDYRAAQGDSAMLVELQDIYDEFSDGVPNPNAIRDFIGYARDNWTTAPEYAVLVGKGSFDYRNLQDAGGNFLPPIMTATPNGLFASDGRYATFADDPIPDLMVGRLPVTTNAQLVSAIAQIMDYEAAETFSDEVLLVADGPDPQAPFETDSDDIADRLDGMWSFDRAYRQEGDLDAFRASLMDQIGASPRIVHYLGHAGSVSLGKNESFFDIDDITSLDLDGEQPLYAMMTCSTSRFAFPGLVSLGEEMTLRDNGAVAVWGPTGLSITSQAQDMGEEFMSVVGEARAAERELRLGPALLDGYRALVDNGGAEFMPRVYGLFGDPALRVVKGNGSGTGGTGGSGSGSGGSGLAGGGLGCAMAASPQRAGFGALMLTLLAGALLYRRRRLN